LTSEEPLTWRVLLGRLTNDLQERQRVAIVLGINPITITRWVTEKSNPRGDNLRLLLKAFPSHRQQFIELIHEEIPHFFLEEETTDEPLSEIPSAFYSNVLRTYTNSPFTLRPSIRITILQQLLTHLDPSYIGMAISICQCVTPEPGQSIQSLREVLGRANLPWHSHLENRTQFLGVESLPGSAVSSGHSIVVQNQSEKSHLFPTHIVEQEESALASPIFSSNRMAGCLYLSSTQKNFFTELRQELVRNYIDLLTLTFEPHEFYIPTQFALGTMPPYEFQQPYLKKFQTRVSQYLKDMQGTQFITRQEAEQVVLRELETQFLHMRYNGDEPVEQQQMS
jgi:hypothetical protein